MRGKIITGIDIGSDTIKIVVALVKSGSGNGQEYSPEIQILGVEQAQSSGIRRGVVISEEEVSNIISPLLDRVQETSGQRIDSAYVNVGGVHISSTSSKGLVSVSRADQKISEIDIDRVVQAAQTFSLPSNKEILEVFPKEFIVDGEKGIKEKDLLEMQGVRLEVEVLVLHGFSPYIKKLTQAVLNSGIRQINALIPSSLARSRAVLDARQKELGVALLDIGSGITELSVYEEGSLIHLATLPIGSMNITKDIVAGLTTDFDTAEKIKLEFGSCMHAKDAKKDKITIDNHEGPLIFTKKQLTGIIEARVTEIFEQVNKELKKISRAGLLPAGIVLTGGGAKLPRITELAKKELKLPSKIGTPQGLYPVQDDPGMATACGLVLMGADLIGERSPSSGKTIFGRLKKILRVFVP